MAIFGPSAIYPTYDYSPVTASADQKVHQAVLAVLLPFLRDAIRTGVGGFLQNTENTLLDTWPDIRDPAEQLTSRLASRWLRANKEAAESGLYRRLLHELAMPATTPSVGAASELGLADEESLVLSVIRTQLVNSVLERTRPEISDLQMRLEALRQAGAPINPKAVMPGAFMDSFAAAVKELNAPNEVRALLMARFADQGAVLLEKIYAGINRLLNEHGVVRPPL